MDQVEVRLSGLDDKGDELNYTSKNMENKSIKLKIKMKTDWSLALFAFVPWPPPVMDSDVDYEKTTFPVIFGHSVLSQQ